MRPRIVQKMQLTFFSAVVLLEIPKRGEKKGSKLLVK